MREKISGVILLFLLLCGVFFLSSCASLGDGVEVRRGHVSSFGEDLSARGVWLDSPRSLEECLSFALENNYNLRLSALQRRLSELDVNSSFANFLPEVSATAGWTGWRHQQTMRGTPVSDKSYSNASLNVQMPIFYPSTWLLYASRKLAREESALSQHVARQGIVAQVTGLYFQCLVDEQQISALESQVEATKSQYERVAAMLEEGQYLQWECTNAEAQYKSKVISLEQARRSMQVDRGRLLQALGLSPMDESRLKLIPPEEGVAADTGALSDLVLRALATRPELSVQDRKIVESENQVRLAVVDFLPVVGGFATGTWTGDDIADRARNLYGGFSAAMDLFKGFSKVTNYKASKVVREAANLQREDLTLSVILEVVSADADLRDAESARQLAQLSYDALSARYEEFRDRYEEGIDPLYRMLDARAEMDDAMLALVQTRYLSEIARVRLDLATGAIVPDSAHWTKEDAEHPMKENLDELLIKEQ